MFTLDLNELHPVTQCYDASHETAIASRRSHCVTSGISSQLATDNAIEYRPPASVNCEYSHAHVSTHCEYSHAHVSTHCEYSHAHTIHQRATCSWRSVVGRTETVLCTWHTASTVQLLPPQHRWTVHCTLYTRHVSQSHRVQTPHNQPSAVSISDTEFLWVARTTLVECALTITMRVHTIKYYKKYRTNNDRWNVIKPSAKIHCPSLQRESYHISSQYKCIWLMFVLYLFVLCHKYPRH